MALMKAPSARGITHSSTWPCSNHSSVRNVSAKLHASNAASLKPLPLLGSRSVGRLGRHAPSFSFSEQSTSEAPVSADDKVPAGCQRYTLRLKKPLGMILEGRDGKIFVAELVKGGAAEKTGEIQVGDELIATSAVIYTWLEDYGGVEVRKGEREVRLMCRGETFSGVMAAIGSVPGARPLTLEFQRCDPGSEEATQ